MRRRNLFGGVLWDLFLIVVLCAGAFIAWRTRDRWVGLLKQVPTASRVSSEKKTVQPKAVHLEKESALAQTRVRQFLADSGLTEKHIVKSFTEARNSNGVFWLESTMEISRPKSFQSGPFLKKVLLFLSQNDLALMRDQSDSGVWTLEFGDRAHVFQRLVIRNK